MKAFRFEDVFTKAVTNHLEPLHGFKGKSALWRKKHPLWLVLGIESSLSLSAIFSGNIQRESLGKGNCLLKDQILNCILNEFCCCCALQRKPRM